MYSRTFYLFMYLIAVNDCWYKQIINFNNNNNGTYCFSIFALLIDSNLHPSSATIKLPIWSKLFLYFTEETIISTGFLVCLIPHKPLASQNPKYRTLKICGKAELVFVKEGDDDDGDNEKNVDLEDDDCISISNLFLFITGWCIGLFKALGTNRMSMFSTI